MSVEIFKVHSRSSIVSTTPLLTQAPARTLIDFPYAHSPNFVILWTQDRIPDPVDSASCDRPGPARRRYSSKRVSHAKLSYLEFLSSQALIL